jgi:spore germination cell wall hydrolase CwlJ-like protein
MKYLLLILLLLFSRSVLTPEPQEEGNLGVSIREDVKAPVEQPMKPQDDSDSWDEHTCLARTIYWESKGESDRGMAMVAQVTLNRVNSDKKYFPNTVCQVIKQRVGKRCMYSFYCDGKSDRPKELTQYKKAERIAINALKGMYKHETTALYFKKCNVISGFFSKLKYLGREGKHCYYK